ncbi:Gfo/Idh/MocA family protein [Paraglaciecola arctica]|uniref:Gfo/Idh/MocA family protein n=1 Tax=Paraglaciecola arctica TaxID=1128911 RepID=UPI001C06C105|nr:Gfo/Idh/MocA family oxidoreductase [Paraglaciecola arctica]MBU3005212.1 Gfo/Idh/MocA family oxidoreductase [Paraglaciecola arctica]
MSDLRLGVIGLGNIGQQHIQHIQSGAVEHCVITALASRSESQLAATIDAKHFTDYRDLIDSNLCDAVLIATPTMSHLEMGLYALSKGLHVLMEKPLGLSVAQGQKLLAAAGQNSVFALMLNQRVAPVFAKMKNIMDSGDLGELQRTHWTMTNWFRPEVYFQVSDWRATWHGEGGGLLLNQCIHNIDIFQWLTGMPVSVQGFCGFGKYHNIEVEDEATAYFEYANGATGVFVGSTGEAPGVNQLDIVGDKGMLSFDGQRLVLTENSPSTSRYNCETKDMFGQPSSKKFDITPNESANQHAIVINNFIQAILNSEELIAPAKQGIDSLSIANAILWSAWSGKPITFPLDANAYQTELNKRLDSSVLRKKSDVKANIDMEASYR